LHIYYFLAHNVLSPELMANYLIGNCFKVIFGLTPWNLQII